MINFFVFFVGVNLLKSRYIYYNLPSRTFVYTNEDSWRHRKPYRLVFFYTCKDGRV